MEENTVCRSTMRVTSCVRALGGLWTFAVPRRTLAAVACSVVLPSTSLPYRGVRLDLAAEDAPSFADRIGPSIEHWRKEGRQSAMLKLPIELAGLASVAAEVRTYNAHSCS